MKQWRSLEELRGEAAPQQGELPPGAEESPPDRREFLKLASASALAAAASGCFREPSRRVAPYSRKEGIPERTPGTPQHFATTFELDGACTGLVVTCREGRPIKVEGNPAHPDSLGASGQIEQSAILQLYDPERARDCRFGGSPCAWDQVRDALAAAAQRDDRGRGLRFLVEPTRSPLWEGVRGQVMARFPEARFYASSAAASGNEARGAQLAFGRPLRAVPRFDKARAVVSLDADFMAALPGNLGHARRFADRRQPGKDMARLYVAETSMTVTGTFADHRLPAAPSRISRVSRALLALVRGGDPGPLSPEEQRWVGAAARDLKAAGAAGLVVAGRRQPPEVHAAAHAICAAIGSLGQAVALYPEEEAPGGLDELAKDLESGQVNTLVITAWNPAYASPADVPFAALARKVPNTFYASLYGDETARAVRGFVAAAHVYESWGDARASDGTVSLVQPMISPLFEGHQPIELVAAFLPGPPRSPYELLRGEWARRRAGAETDFDLWLADGLIQGSAQAPIAPPAVKELPQEKPAAVQGLELAVEVDTRIYDGRFANVPWLQELPHPITKITWDNAALVAPSTAAALGYGGQQRMKLTSGGRSLEIVLWEEPGHAKGAVTVALGYGQDLGGTVGKGRGFDVNAIRSASSPWFAPAALERVPGYYPIATTQQHASMEGRELVLHRKPGDLEKDPDQLARLREPPEAFYGPYWKKEGTHQWALAVDLNRCTGCSACVIACQAENNIPSVGKQWVIKSRWMHWLRIDRYFEGSADAPRALMEPMFCQHCETAPCEYVCPVNATVHSDEGLNEMVYNRCVGTRYCSNNCPYKVRRFNFLDYTPPESSIRKLAENPNVTVRSRGVMEKCTYCVQRIEEARIRARSEGREIREGEIVMACQQACPTGVFTFGDLSDASSAVSRAYRDVRRYDVLHDAGTRPRTVYLVRLDNPSPELE